MLVFIDESGDSGIKLVDGSSHLFVLSLVLFEDSDMAEACSLRISALRRELNWSFDSEFHFKRNSDRIRE